MSRRIATLTTAGVALVLLVCAAVLLPVPYVTLHPGPTRDVLGSVNGSGDGAPIVEITGHRTYPTHGSLSLTTVSVTAAGERISLLEAFRSWFSSEDAVVPHDAIYDPSQSVSQAEQQSATQMATSQEVAAVAALRLLGDDVPETDAVGAVTAGSPADGVLRVGDVLVSVDGKPVDGLDRLLDLIRDRSPGDDVDLRVRRDGKPVDVTVTTVPSDDDPAVPVIGITPVAVDYALPFPVHINLGADIGGPSAGTVFALAVYDKLTPGPLIGDMDVAGTGEIGADGEVGAIGGIQQKIVGAADGGATVFLVPSANCQEAEAAQVDGITLVDITTLGDAVDALTALADDPDADVPTCG